MIERLGKIKEKLDQGMEIERNPGNEDIIAKVNELVDAFNSLLPKDEPLMENVDPEVEKEWRKYVRTTFKFQDLAREIDAYEDWIDFDHQGNLFYKVDKEIIRRKAVMPLEVYITMDDIIKKHQDERK
jgi:hypothetical protein